MKKYLNLIDWRYLFWITMIIVTVLALIPWSQNMPKPFQISDKLNHFMAFAVLVNLLLLSYYTTYIKAFFYMFLYGAGIEAIQYFLPWRSADWLDLTVDAIATLAGLLIYHYITKRVFLYENRR